MSPLLYFDHDQDWRRSRPLNTFLFPLSSSLSAPQARFEVGKRAWNFILAGMNRNSLFFILLLISSIVWGFGASQDGGKWRQLFDGASLDGWTPSNENPNSYFVEDGVLVLRGGRSHLFYTGPVGGADFKNFELKLEAKTTPGSNSGVYFHTAYQDKGWPGKGFEAQVNTTHKDPKKREACTGSPTFTFRRNRMRSRLS